MMLTVWPELTKMQREKGRETGGIQNQKAKLNDVHAVVALIRAVWEQMDNREWFVMDEADFLKDVLESGRGFIYMAIDAGTEKLAGVMDILTPGLEKIISDMMPGSVKRSF